MSIFDTGKKSSGGIFGKIFDALETVDKFADKAIKVTEQGRKIKDKVSSAIPSEDISDVLDRDMAAIEEEEEILEAGYKALKGNGHSVSFILNKIDEIDFYNLDARATDSDGGYSTISYVCNMDLDEEQSFTVHNSGATVPTIKVVTEEVDEDSVKLTAILKDTDYDYTYSVSIRES